MSWSFYGVGKPAAVAAKFALEASQYKCAEPEETIRSKIVDIVAVSLSAYPEASAVNVKASGSQMSDSKTPGKFINTLTISVEHLYGFAD